MLVFGLIVFASLSPFALRPVLISHREGQQVAAIERALAFGLFGYLVAISWPNRTQLTCAFVVGMAIFLELAQALRPDRHSELADALEKIAGGLTGIFLAGWITRKLVQRSRDSL